MVVQCVGWVQCTAWVGYLEIYRCVDDEEGSMLLPVCIIAPLGYYATQRDCVKIKLNSISSEETIDRKISSSCQQH